MNDCRIWPGTTNRNGYGVLWLNGQRHAAHRFIFELLRGPIADGLQLDHLCRNRQCVNPDHLEPVTNQVNVLRGTGPSAVNASRTHCVHGHVLDEMNTYLDGSRRRCRECTNRRQRERTARRRAATAGASA